jgi:hypothetical protein
MLAVIRASLTGTTGAGWSDATVRALLDPNRPFSLAEFWARSSFSEADTTYFLFQAFAFGDPRGSLTKDEARKALVEKALAEVSTRFDPDWDLFEAALLLFEGQVDMFGGGSYILPTRPGSDLASIPVAVVDQLSPFGSMCQELGHAFGFAHELAMPSLTEYGSPYSSMSAEVWANHFDRPPDPTYTNLPIGAVGRDEPLRHVGPYITPAQFVASASTTLVHPQSVMTPTQDVAKTPWPVSLVALDRAIAEWPTRHPVVAVVPPYSAGARTYYLEVRRKRDYDQGLQFGTTGQANAGLVIHSWDPVTKRIIFEGAIGFGDGKMDYRSFSGWFIVRVVSWDPELGLAHLRVYGGESWRQFSVDLDGPHVDRSIVNASVWLSTEASPCGSASTGIYQYRLLTLSTEISVAAIAYGFESPSYLWYLNGRALTGGTDTFALQLPGKKVQGTGLVDAGVVNCNVTFWTVGNRIKFLFPSAFSSMSMELSVVVSESSSAVVKSGYPDKSVTTTFHVDNVTVEWDGRYQNAKIQCWRRYWERDKGFKPGQVKIKFDPRPQWQEFAHDIPVGQGLERLRSPSGRPAATNGDVAGLLREALDLNARLADALGEMGGIQRQ